MLGSSTITTPARKHTLLSERCEAHDRELRVHAEDELNRVGELLSRTEQAQSQDRDVVVAGDIILAMRSLLDEAKVKVIGAYYEREGTINFTLTPPGESLGKYGFSRDKTGSIACVFTPDDGSDATKFAITAAGSLVVTTARMH